MARGAIARSSRGERAGVREWCSWPQTFAKTVRRDRKSTRLNSSHGYISYAVFCLKKKMVTSLWNVLAQWVPGLHTLEAFGRPGQFAAPLAVSTAVLGLLGVFCSAMIYIDTHRPF